MRVALVSLGCDKNLVDSERMLGLLSEAGYELTDDEAAAEVIVVNTCCFISDAMEESINELIRLGQYREGGRLKALIACGCLAERYADAICEELPEVTAVVGTNSYEELPRVIEEALSGEKPTVCLPLTGLPSIRKRVLSTAGHYAYLKISEGCDKSCSYCVIPSIRGHYRSYPIEELVAEARSLAEGGVRELILVAQETTLYGIDLYGKRMLPELLRQLAAIDDLAWIRLLYCYPEEITDELIAVIRDEKKVLPYLDLPIQHASDRILKAMGRRTDKASLTALIQRLREEIPGICLRTTVIAGFPGETDEDHRELLDFLNEARFDRLGAFAFSPQEGTPAAEMDGQIPDEVKNARVAAIMEQQQRIIFEANEALVAGLAASDGAYGADDDCDEPTGGYALEVLVEGRLPEENVWVGRSYRDAPDVDGLVFFTSEDAYMTGDIVRVRITDTNEYDLVGEVTE